MLRVLVEEQVEFIVVGGVAAALQGAPVLTQDVDILYRIEGGNIERLERALDRLNAVARHDPRNLRELGRPKDRAMLPVLEATLREKNRP